MIIRKLTLKNPQTKCLFTVTVQTDDDMRDFVPTDGYVECKKCGTDHPLAGAETVSDIEIEWL